MTWFAIVVFQENHCLSMSGGQSIRGLVCGLLAPLARENPAPGLSLGDLPATAMGVLLSLLYLSSTVRLNCSEIEGLMVWEEPAPVTGEDPAP